MVTTDDGWIQANSGSWYLHAIHAKSYVIKPNSDTHKFYLFGPVLKYRNGFFTRDADSVHDTLDDAKRRAEVLAAMEA